MTLIDKIVSLICYEGVLQKENIQKDGCVLFKSNQIKIVLLLLVVKEWTRIIIMNVFQSHGKHIRYFLEISTRVTRFVRAVWYGMVWYA